MVDTWVFAVITLIYLTVIFYLGYLGYKRTKGHDDYLIAGRKINPVVLALSYGATFISTSAIVGFGGVAGQLGMSLMWLTVLVVMVGILIAFIVYGKRTRRLGRKLNALTFPDLLGKRYGSPFMQGVSALVILVAMPLYSAAVLIGGARFIETTLSVNFDAALLAFALIVALYVILGGLIAVMYTDALQGGIMLVGMIVLIILAYSLLGGVTQANADLGALVDQVDPSAISGLVAGGFNGWTAMPDAGSPIWLTLITTITLGVGIGVLAQPQLVVRFMTVKDDRALNRAIAIGGPFTLIMTGVAFTVGALSNVWFFKQDGLTAMQAVDNNVDQIIPLFINQSMPDLFVIVFMLALLAAAMSTLSSLFHTMGTSAGYDLRQYINLKRKRPIKDAEDHAERRASFKASRVGTLAMIVVSVIVAYLMPISIIARATAMFMGLCAAAFLPSFTHALYSKRPSTIAAKASLAVGTVTWFMWTAFVHIKESSAIGLCQWLFGRPSLLDSPWTVVDPLVIALPASTLVMIMILLIQRQRAVIPTTA